MINRVPGESAKTHQRLEMIDLGEVRATAVPDNVRRTSGSYCTIISFADLKCEGDQQQLGLFVIPAQAGIQFLQRLSGYRIKSGMTQSNKWDSSGSSSIDTLMIFLLTKTGSASQNYSFHLNALPKPAITTVIDPEHPNQII